MRGLETSQSDALSNNGLRYLLVNSEDYNERDRNTIYMYNNDTSSESNTFANYPIAFSRIQFKITDRNHLFVRIRWGGGNWTDWKTLI